MRELQEFLEALSEKDRANIGLVATVVSIVFYVIIFFQLPFPTDLILVLSLVASNAFYRGVADLDACVRRQRTIFGTQEVNIQNLERRVQGLEFPPECSPEQEEAEAV